MCPLKSAPFLGDVICQSHNNMTQSNILIFLQVPGTEYVLPQHLEDIYRWIHPRQPDPGNFVTKNLRILLSFPQVNIIEVQ